MEKIQTMLSIFVQCLQNTNDLTQKIFQFISLSQVQKEVPCGAGEPADQTSFSNNNNNFAEPRLE